jgi:hypothetical protein
MFTSPAQNWTEELETQLAIEIINLFGRESLTTTQARNLIEKLRVLVDAGELGFLQQSP